jgi:DnaK suppressor protein
MEKSREEVFQEIKKRLIDQKRELIEEAEETLHVLPGELNYPDMGDQAAAESDRNFMLRLKDRERKLITKIDEAIERINKGEYDVCEECGGQISLKRLQARPVTTLCIECKTSQEEFEKVYK